MNADLLSELIETAVQAEGRRLLKRSNIDLARLAESHAIKMLEEIQSILDADMPLEDKFDCIVKILAFFPVSPHRD